MTKKSKTHNYNSEELRFLKIEAKKIPERRPPNDKVLKFFIEQDSKECK